MTTGANLLLIGPPKCATSTLHSWLVTHPQVAAGNSKELFFLMDRGHPLQGRPSLAGDGLGAYGDHFDEAARRAAIRIDSTTHYLFQDAALDYMDSAPECRAIAVLRDPAERVYSSFSYTQNNLALLDPNLAFADYLRLVAAGEPLYPRYCRSRSSAFVLERDVAYSDYAQWLVGWFERAGRGRIDVLLTEDLAAGPAKTTAPLFATLGLPPLGDEAFAAGPRNVTRSISYAGLHRRLQSLNAAVRIPSWLKAGLLQGYFRLQAGRAGQEKPGKSRDDQDALAGLREKLQPSIVRLEDMLGRDLAAWRQTGTAR